MRVVGTLVVWDRDQKACRAKRIALAAMTITLLSASGCKSRFITATIQNDTGQPVRMVELDYPGASFGVSVLAPYAQYSYRFKALGTGPLTLSYIEAAGAPHNAAGPVVNDAQGGVLRVNIGEHGAVTWNTH